MDTLRHYWALVKYRFICWWHSERRIVTVKRKGSLPRILHDGTTKLLPGSGKGPVYFSMEPRFLWLK